VSAASGAGGDFNLTAATNLNTAAAITGSTIELTATGGTLGLGAAVGTAAATNSVTLVSNGSINSAATVAVKAATAQ